MIINNEDFAVDLSDDENKIEIHCDTPYRYLQILKKASTDFNVGMPARVFLKS